MPRSVYTDCLLIVFPWLGPTDAEDAFELSPEVLVSRDEGIYESKLVVKNQLDREAIATAYEFVVKVCHLGLSSSLLF